MKRIIRNHIKSNNNMLHLSIGKISNLKQIGEGANGLIYQGNLHQELIAIKFLTSPSDDSKLVRFKSEFLNISLLSTNNLIAKLISYEELKIDNQVVPTILMKRYLESVKRKSNKPPAKPELEHLFKFLLEALKFIHNHGIIHRDLKPENILVDKEGFVLSDFGIAYYNPDIFKLKPKTRKGERLANYLFSAPEQGESSTAPSKTMDIFALGQICQWYATGRIHRGTHRESIMKYVPNSQMIDKVVDKCLSNNAKDRFQSIEEIEDFLRSKREKPEKSFLHYLRLFGRALAKTFPKNLSEVIFSHDDNVINKLLNNLAEMNFDNEFWWHDGYANCPAKLKKLRDDIWLLDLHEIKIKSIWVYFDLSLYKDAVLINTEAMPSFGIYDAPYEYEEAGLVDDEYYITRNEYDNGYAEINGKTINLSDHKVSLRIRYLRPKSFFIITRYHSIFAEENEDRVHEFISKIESGYQITKTEFKSFIDEIGKKKHREVLRSL